jgi:hypothetical protein
MLGIASAMKLSIAYPCIYGPLTHLQSVFDPLKNGEKHHVQWWKTLRRNSG